MHQVNNTTRTRAKSRVVPTFHQENGYTFIEIMIAVTIVGILAALALPSYGNYVRDARRADGHLALLQEAQTMERCRSTRWTYANCTLSSATSPEKYYTIELTQSDATSYTLTATAANKQANDTACSPLTLNHLGNRGPVNSASDPNSDCWKN